MTTIIAAATAAASIGGERDVTHPVPYLRRAGHSSHCQAKGRHQAYPTVPPICACERVPVRPPWMLEMGRWDYLDDDGDEFRHTTTPPSCPCTSFGAQCEPAPIRRLALMVNCNKGHVTLIWMSTLWPPSSASSRPVLCPHDPFPPALTTPLDHEMDDGPYFTGRERGFGTSL
jgi:hypothetical protein